MILNCIYRNAKLTRNFFVTHFRKRLMVNTCLQTGGNLLMDSWILDSNSSFSRLPKGCTLSETIFCNWIPARSIAEKRISVSCCLRAK